MTKLTSRSLLITAVAVATLSSPLANAGIFGIGDEKGEAPWKDADLLQKSTCVDTGIMEMKNFLDKYTPKKIVKKDIKKGSDQLMSSYVISSLAITQANLCMAEALEMDELKAEIIAHRDNMKGGTSFSSKENETEREFAEEAINAISEEAAKVDALTPEQQKSFAVGISTFILGTYKTYTIKEDAEDLNVVVQKEMEKAKSASSGGLSFGSLKKTLSSGGDYAAAGETLSVVLQGMPEHLPKLISTSKMLLDYAKDKGIKVETDGSSEAKKLGLFD